MNDMRESLAELLRFTIAERDTFYECCSDPDGVMQDEDDQRELARLDAMIDRARAALGVQS
jgi:hypothetical protein